LLKPAGKTKQSKLFDRVVGARWEVAKCDGDTWWIEVGDENVKTEKQPGCRGIKTKPIETTMGGRLVGEEIWAL
jgi:hypothetical protein